MHFSSPVKLLLAALMVVFGASALFVSVSHASTSGCTVLGPSCGNNQNSQTYGWASAAQSAAYDNPVLTVWNGTANEAVDWVRTSPSANVFRYEYAPNGVRSGMCVSDPGDFMVRLRTCNVNNWQKWREGNSGTGGKQLVNVATNRSATPNGNGAQLTTGGSDVAHSYWTWVGGVTPTPTPTPTTPTPTPTGTNTILNSKTLCLYKGALISEMNAFSTALGKTINCGEIFANSEACWNTGGPSPCDAYSGWTDPWYDHGTGDSDWNTWIKADPNRRIIISHNLVPLDISQNMGDGKYNPNWRADCANGAYSQYYPILAQNLINAGFGHAVVRLGHEMNGDWYSGALGSDSSQYANWAKCFANTVTGMRSVAGANFLFDWNVNQGYRNIPFASYYPGDAFVDIVGMDAYDSGMPGNPPSQPARWNAEYTEGSGLSDFIAFANSHSKPVSLPEWGLADTADGGIGDDPYYVQQIANVVGSNNVAYQSYFDPGTSGIPKIENSPNSWPNYKNAFGPNGTVTDRPW